MEEERQERLLSGQSLAVPPHCLWGGGKSRLVCVCVCVWLKARRGSSCIRLVYRGLFDRVSREGSGLVDSGRRGAAFHQAVD